jgi:hypothetical protein
VEHGIFQFFRIKVPSNHKAACASFGLTIGVANPANESDSRAVIGAMAILQS